MDISKILSHCDHTLLAVDATWEQIKQVCDDGIRFSTASVCIPASYVAKAKEYVGDKLPICTVIGFPNGYSTTAVKAFEAADAVAKGAPLKELTNIDAREKIGRAKSVPEAEYPMVYEAIRKDMADQIDAAAAKGGEF